MSEQGFNFRPPPRREVKKAFEPPPWEKEAFEDLARRREDEKTAAEIAAAIDDEQVPVAVSEASETQQATPVEPAIPRDPAAPDSETVTGASDEDDARVEAMMLGLRNEEPPFGTQLWKASIAAGAVLASVGAVLWVWGIVAITAARRASVVGSLAGGILIVLGLGFVAVGGWMAFRVLRQRGVL